MSNEILNEALSEEVLNLYRMGRKWNAEPFLASQSIPAHADKGTPKKQNPAFEDYIRSLPFGSKLPRGKYFQGRSPKDNLYMIDELWLAKK
ncbi:MULTISPECIES: hypothetical protein [Acinetobacter]|uniref:hypothetical protein n=1 Tax=Acinetobacter TaxID=469 RepID=UPI0030F466C2